MTERKRLQVKDDGPPDLLPAQMELLQCRERIVAFVAGYGAGKTFSACLKAITLAMANPGMIGLFVEPTFKMVKMIAMRDMKTALRRLNVKYREVKSENMLELWVGEDPQWTPIYFMSADNPDSLNGPTVAWIILDETGMCKDEVFDKLLARFREPRALQPQYIIVGTPEGGPGTRFGQLAEFGAESMRVHRLIRAKTLDNPFLPKEYLEEMEAKFTPEEFRCYCEGIFVAGGGQVYRWNAPKMAKVFPRDFDFHDAPGTVQVAADWNVTKVVWLLVYVENGVAHVFDEVVSLNTYTDEQALKVKRRLRQWGIADEGVTVYHDAKTSGRSVTARRDATASSDVNECHRAGFKTKANRTNPAIRDRINAVNKKLKAETLFVDPRCSELVKSLSTQGRDKNGQPDKSGGLDHAVDALGYLVFWQWPVQAMRNLNSPRQYH